VSSIIQGGAVTNKNHVRIASAVVGTIAAAGVGLALAPAEAQAPAAKSHVTATPTDTTPASGQTFRVSGAVTSKGEGLPSTITVKALKSEVWVPLSGATMHTDSTGHYTIRVILDAKGERPLRIVANPDGSHIRSSRSNFDVTVH
jgi:hypothetical protein